MTGRRDSPAMFQPRSLLCSIVVLLTISKCITARGECEQEGYFCDPADPTKFYLCDSGNLYSYQCPGGLYFSARDQLCNWPQLADCLGGQAPTTNYVDFYQTTIGPVYPGKPPVTPYFPEGPATPYYPDTTVRPVRPVDPVDSFPTRGPSYPGRPSRECNPSTCRLPTCYCPGTSIPQGLSPYQTPQMVMLTFDDEVSSQYTEFFNTLFRPGRSNPNGCQLRGAAFVSGSGTEYSLVNPLRNKGVEIAVHSITHRFPYTWWSTASYDELVQEAVGMRNNLINQAGIPADSMIGYRSPFLELSGDNLYRALYDNGFAYDSSMFATSEDYDDVPVWPFTLDFSLEDNYCQISNCPNNVYPGLWEIPIQGWTGLDGSACSMPDGCSPTANADQTFQYFLNNFRRYYQGNRAPLGIFIHARWFNAQSHNIEGLDRFIDYLLNLDDVYIVSPSQVIEWMKDPTPLNEIRNFQPWSC